MSQNVESANVRVASVPTPGNAWCGNAIGPIHVENHFRAQKVISSLFSGSKNWVLWYYKLLRQNNAIYILRNKNPSYWQSFSGENKLCFHFSFRWGWLNLSLCLTSLISSANLAGLARLERIWPKLLQRLGNSFNYVLTSVRNSFGNLKHQKKSLTFLSWAIYLNI